MTRWARLLSHPYFAAPPPKSLDRYDFPLSAVDGLRVEDAAATLVAFTAETVRRGVALAEEPPQGLIACGGGRHNPELMQAIADRLDCELIPAEAVGWRGDADRGRGLRLSRRPLGARPADQASAAPPERPAR